MIEITAKKSRGPYKGNILYPHKYLDGMYVASLSKFEEDYIRVKSLEELAILIKSGYKARMSNPAINSPPSGIISRNICINTKTSPDPEKFLKSLIEDVDMDGDSKAKTRIEQAFLRANLLNGEDEGKCVICQNHFPADLLIAAHIKKRSVCNKVEKGDYKNVVALMCKFGCDDLFEKGYIFVEHSKVQVNGKKTKTHAVNDALSKIINLVVSNWSGSKNYYEWHKSNVAI